MARTSIGSAPNVYIKEIDRTQAVVVPGISTGAIVARAKSGPVNALTLVQDEQTLIGKFGTPILSGIDTQTGRANDIDYGIYAGIEFLKESNATYFVRWTDGTEIYANTLIQNPISNISSAAGTNLFRAIETSAYETETIKNMGYKNGNTDSAIYDLDTVSFSTVSGVSARYLSTSYTGATVSADLSDSLFGVFARGPGLYGNNIAISITTTAIGQTSLSANSSYGPLAFNWKYLYEDVSDVDNADAINKKVFKINVFTKTETQSWSSVWSGISASPVESFLVSKDITARDANGNSLYIEDVINGSSDYIYIQDNTANTQYPGIVEKAFLFGGGYTTGSKWTGRDVTGVNVSSAWTLFRNRDYSSINIAIFADPFTSSTQAAIDSLLSYRKDFIAVTQIGYRDTSSTANTTSMVLQYDSLFDALQYPSYVAKYCGWDLVSDRYNNSRVYIPKAIFGASIMARTDYVAETWDAPCFLERGSVPSIKQAYDYDLGEIGVLYDSNVNTSRRIQGTGFFMWGQKTAQKKETALNRINVRRLLLYIENRLDSELLNYLGSPNNDKTRGRVTSTLDSFLSGIKTAGGLNGYSVKCNRTNNSDDSNTLNIDVYVQPTYTIEFIQLNVIVTKSGISISEV